MSGIVGRVSQCWYNTAELPWFVSLYCKGGMVVAPIMFLVVLIPFGSWRVNGQSMAYGEFWRSGAAISALLLSGVMFVASWGTAARKSWSRIAWVLAPILPLVTFPRGLVVNWVHTGISSLVWMVATYVVLFRWRRVREYFEAE
jgi:hypothetical protein